MFNRTRRIINQIEHRLVKRKVELEDSVEPIISEIFRLYYITPSQAKSTLEELFTSRSGDSSFIPIQVTEENTTRSIIVRGKEPDLDVVDKLIKEIKEELNKSDLDIKNLNFSDIKDIPDIFIDKKKSSFPENIIKKVFKGVLTALIENKQIEGYKIKKTFSDRIKKIHKNLKSLANEVAKNKHKRKKNILNKLPSSLVVSDESISNEVVNQIIKSDISEEIDRLGFHKSSLLEELGSKKAKGKKIDFILLEMLREVNTILAKVTFT